MFQKNLRASKICKALIKVSIVLCIVTYIYISWNVYRVETASMWPTAKPGAVLLCRSAALSEQRKRGQIVAFRTPISRLPIIKRVIGIPGDSIQVIEGRTLLNGERLPEPFAVSDGAAIGSSPDQAKVVIPTGKLFVMGDNRRRSVDSREFGPIEATNVVSTCDIVFNPLFVFNENPK